LADGEPGPGHLTLETELIEPARLIAVDALGEDVALPCHGGDLEALQLRHHVHHAALAVAALLTADSVTGQQVAHEVLGTHGLDLAAQAVDGPAMDARQQAAVAE